jgi:hypothetical protein
VLSLFVFEAENFAGFDPRDDLNMYDRFVIALCFGQLVFVLSSYELAYYLLSAGHILSDLVLRSYTGTNSYHPKRTLTTT